MCICGYTDVCVYSEFIPFHQNMQYDTSVKTFVYSLQKV